MHPKSSDIDSSSIRYQYYDPEVYDEYVREETHEGGKTNNFVRMGLKTEVLYNPERDENGVPTDKKLKAEVKTAGVEVNGNTKSPEQLEAERLEAEKALTAQKEAEAAIQKKKEAEIQKKKEAEIQKKKEADDAKKLAAAEKSALPIREVTVNDVVFEVFQNSAKTLYTAKQKGGEITGEGKTLALLNEDLQKNTSI